MAIAIPLDSAHVSAMEKVSPGTFFYWIHDTPSVSELCVGISTPQSDSTRRAFVRLTGGDRFRVKTTAHLSSLCVILLPNPELSFEIGNQGAQVDTVGRAGDLCFTASGPVLSVWAVAGNGVVYIDMRTWAASFSEPEFNERFSSWQLVHTTANGVEQPMISVGTLE